MTVPYSYTRERMASLPRQTPLDPNAVALAAENIAAYLKLLNGVDHCEAVSLLDRLAGIVHERGEQS